MKKCIFFIFLLLFLFCAGCQISPTNTPAQFQNPFQKRVKTCMLDYVIDKDYVNTVYERIFTGNTYLSCLYHTILANRNGVGFPYFIKAYENNTLQRLVEPTITPLYFDQNLIDTKMNISNCSTRDSENKISINVYEGCKGHYDFAHYLITGTVITDTCRFIGCENLSEGEECLGDDPQYHYKTCWSLVPSYQKDFEIDDPTRNDKSIRPRYMYQKHLPLVYRNQWYFEDVHIWRYYGEIPIQLDPNSSEVQELEAIVDDGQEHLFDIVETNMLGTDGYGNGVAFRKIIQ